MEIYHNKIEIQEQGLASYGPRNIGNRVEDGTRDCGGAGFVRVKRTEVETVQICNEHETRIGEPTRNKH